MTDLHKAYYDKSMILRAQELFLTSNPIPHIKLNKIFSPKTYQSFKKQINALSYKRSTDLLQYNIHQTTVPKNLSKKITKELLPLLNTIVQKRITSLTFNAFSLSHKDYMLANKPAALSSFSVILDFTHDWNPAWGGSVVFADQNGEHIDCTPEQNTCYIVFHQKGIRRFIRYLNHYAKKRTFLLATFR